MFCQLITDFFNRPILTVIGDISTIILVFGIFYGIFLVINGVLPVWIRLGKGLSRRKIAIFASDDFDSLKDLLIDSKIFKEKNIIKINKDSLKKSKDFSLLLVHWKAFQDVLSDILEFKSDKAALIIYAPQDEGLICGDDLKMINNQRYSIIVNMRGRLVNDLLTSMITTSYE